MPPEDKRHALDAVTAFTAAYETTFPTAVATITDDIEVLLAVDDVPAEHRIHLRTTNPIESTFATVQAPDDDHLRARLAGLAMAMAMALIEAAQDRRRAVNGPHLIAPVRAGATFDSAKLVERPGNHHQPEAA